jgi:hypothetical protein
MSFDDQYTESGHPNREIDAIGDFRQDLLRRYKYELQNKHFGYCVCADIV